MKFGARSPNCRKPSAARFVSSFGITPYDAEVLTNTQALADYFESVVKAGAPVKRPPTGCRPNFFAA